MSAKKKQKKNLLPRLLCRILGSVLIAAVFVFLLLINIPQILGNEVYNVVSGSMEPEIPVGSMIVVEPADAVTLVPDDIIAFYREASVITHRVTFNNAPKSLLRTKGDANEQEDFFDVRYDQVIGKVIWHVPYLGYVAQILTSTVGKVYMLAVLACGIMFHMIAGKLKVLAE